ncbi:hypothetical protein ASPZODRAFT_19823 [Penicilliopsis zonata CBS 506.65]|uniref:Signal peptide peptidase n=1 Tax=Penicilliopsis zonata CBS 506.65 TaxID=1073090 RepID=A0A1L9S7J3_9EURO|nr:hypothetical protein ASPZODRAFT_19823 [Penicilliopsis zonata CBS 506.65]OJJ43131.1 hypothetical protein ASPZODRAFT_19823 [Penicilliopsis zonata CBS 506.65]
MAEVSPMAELLGQAIYHFEAVKPLLPTYAHLLVSAIFPIFIGAHASLSKPSSAAKPSKRDDNGDEQDTEDDEEEEEETRGPVQKMEGLEPSDALMFPLTAGLTLGGLYLVIKWLEDPAILNKILSFYFSQMGLFFAIAFLQDALHVVRSFVFPRRYAYGGKVWKVRQSERIFAVVAQGSDGSEARRSPLPGVFSCIPLPESVSQGIWAVRQLAYRRVQFHAHVRGVVDVKCMIGLLDVASGLIALSAVGYFAFVTKPWWLTNFLGFCFCYGALQFMSPSTFWTGTLLLGSLFFYDIYFVFFTPLMVTVATKLDVPIKLLFPRPPAAGQAPDAVSLAMLGLGDIVIPGMMIGLALRFDLFMYYKRKGEQKAQAEGAGNTSVKPTYQSATGAWGERFWARLSQQKPREPELAPPYSDARAFSKIYFIASVVGYCIGMIATLIAMQIANHAQPALLYLVPGVLISLWGTALVRGEVRDMWDFSDADEEENDDGAETETKNDVSSEKAKDHRSLLARLWSGDIKSLVVKEDGKKDGTTSEEKTVLAREDSSADEGKEEDLLFIRISLPRKPKKEKKPTEAAEQPSSEDGEAILASFPSGERDSEPPAKRRRRSPRNMNA